MPNAQSGIAGRELRSHHPTLTLPCKQGRDCFRFAYACRPEQTSMIKAKAPQKCKALAQTADHIAHANAQGSSPHNP
ncbi:hypothetical protein GCM10007902_47220 [Dyella nitratireducens]|nr:hypothetical protein GCM10007902_47220 [Dyella nitratireducens]